ncbi:hypothetical protein ACQP2P_22200 [Dactylosporangium sp. CA-139114]|uniref:hypothetical protein n=1 Tax=Dactylosporangium sp. CA-139114 TaxID=3239931 RepID=UPI003D97C5C6
MQMARGQQVDAEEVLRRSRRGRRNTSVRSCTRSPRSARCGAARWSSLCEKWYGSHEAMFAAAQEPGFDAPPGSGVTMLPLLAHFEYAMREYCWGKVTRDGLISSRRYFQRPAVQRELDDCVTRWRSPGVPAHTQALTCENWLAVAYALSGRRDECKAVFERIGPYAASHVWGYFFGAVSGGFIANWRWANRVR